MSATASTAARRAGVECTIPILRVNDLRASLAHYASVLGFTREWGADDASPQMASVSRTGRSIMLCERGQGNAGTWVWVGVDDAEALHEEYRASGATIIEPPTNYYWALEFKVRDPDGHVLRFGSDPRTDLPFVTP